MIIVFLIFVIIAYLLGSLSSAVIVCKLMGLPDPRTTGSGNPGATNVLRSAGKQAAALTLLGDVIKGFLPVVIARMLGLTDFLLGLVAVAAVVGHIFPAFFNFKGGKGTATAIGTFFGISLVLGLLSAIVFFVVLGASRYASLASLSAIGVALILSPFIAGVGFFIPILIIALLVAWRHQDNIQRLRNGTEEKMDLKFQ